LKLCDDSLPVIINHPAFVKSLFANRFLGRKITRSDRWLSVRVPRLSVVYRERERGYDFSIQFFVPQNHSKRRHGCISLSA